MLTNSRGSVYEQTSKGWSLACILRPGIEEEDEYEQGLVPQRFYRFLKMDLDDSQQTSTIHANSIKPSSRNSPFSLDGLPATASDPVGFNTAVDIPPNTIDTVTIDGAVFELATPTPSATSAGYDQSDYFSLPQNHSETTPQLPISSMDEQDGAVSHKDASAALERHFASGQVVPSSSKGDAVAQFPTEIQQKTFRKLLSPEPEGALPGEHGPNVQPLPPSFPNVHRKEKLSLSMDKASRKMRDVSMRGPRNDTPGGWLDSGAARWVTDGSMQNLSPEERRKLALTSDSPESNQTQSDELTIDSDLFWVAKEPPFNISVHSPTTAPEGYTVFQVSSFKTRVSSEEGTETKTISRRFSDFAALESSLRSCYNGLVLPPLPERRYIGRLEQPFVEQRRRDLERWLARVIRHPVLRSSRQIQHFLSEQESRECLLTSLQTTEPFLFDRIYHEDFAVDLDKVAGHSQAFEKSCKADQGGGKLARIEQSLEGLCLGARGKSHQEVPKHSILQY